MLRQRLPRHDTLTPAHAGILMGVSAHVFWGLVPLYFSLLAVVPPTVILGYRIIFAAALMAVLLKLLRIGPAVREAFADPRTLGLLTFSALLVAGNWLTFIYAVVTGRTLEASLGYFITPLAIVLLGVVALGERLNRVQTISLAIACFAVGYKVYATGSLPWISLALPATFGVYPLIRKTAAADSRTALTIEMFVLAPLGIGYIAFCHAAGRVDDIPWSTGLLALLSLSGVLTVAPLLLYGGAAKRLPLRSLGFIQYLGPTLQMFVAVLFLGETFTADDAIVFGLIWLALVFYTTDAVHRERRRRSIARSLT